METTKFPLKGERERRGEEKERRGEEGYKSER
jgi:hypothetical protein